MSPTLALMLLLLLVVVLTNLVGAITTERQQAPRSRSPQAAPLVIDGVTATALAKIHRDTDAAVAELTALYDHTLAELHRLR